MSLLDQLFSKKETKEFFLALNVEKNHISAATVSLIGNEATTIGTGESEYQDLDKEDEAWDRAISLAEKNLPGNILTEKVILCVPMSYLKDDKIKEEYLDKLKKICKELSLKPQGFIEQPQALSFYFEKQEESPATLIFISLDSEEISISLIRIGKLEKNFIVKRSESFIKDFEKSLSHFTSEVLPSRIIIYSEDRKKENNEALREDLSKFPWHKHSSFLHTPKIEIFSSGLLLNALIETAAGSIVKEIRMNEEKIEKPAENPAENSVEEKIKTLRKEQENEIKEEDIKEEPQKITASIEEENDIFGFVKGKDINTQSAIHEEKHTELLFETKEIEEKEPLFAPKKNVFSSFTKLSFPRFSFKLGPIAAITAMIAICVSLLIYLIFFYPKATINLIVYPTSAAKQIEVIFSQTTEKKEPGKNYIPAKQITQEINGDKTISVTGKKSIGETAKGEVTIYNKTINSKTFPKGTVLTADSIQFSLDEDVNIASASDTGEGMTFGKITTKTTAVEIGPEGNIASGKTFTFKDFPQTSYYAKNSQNFSGGTSREVSSVSKIDQDRLIIVLSDELVSKAKQKLMQKLEVGEKLLDTSISKDIISKQFTKDIGSESKEISLSLNLKVSALSYKENELIDITRDSFAGAPSGYTLDINKTQVKIEPGQTDKNGNLTAKATITAYYFPQIDKEAVKESVKGKKYEQASKEISANPNIGGLSIINEKSLPFFKDTLPRQVQNISVNILPH